MTNPIQVITFYKFKNLTSDQVEHVEAALYALADQIDKMAGEKMTVRGLMILGTEGLNSTVSTPRQWADELKNGVMKILETDTLTFKDSFANKQPFHNFKVKIRDEIVTLGRTDIVPQVDHHHHLKPKEWHEVIANENPVIIDTRNSFEYEVGHFKNAIDPKIEEFSEYPAWLKKANIDKDQKILIYCTGGIRCEKAIYEMEEQGFKNVYQLDGGILNYLKEYPNAHFNGECFVFDYRVAVDQELNPTQKYRLCPHCGQPAKELISCIQCGIDEIVCDKCLETGAKETGDIMRNQYRTCSKNCAHHFILGHKTTRVHEDAFRKRGGADLSQRK